jgi:hypothetical protein
MMKTDMTLQRGALGNELVKVGARKAITRLHLAATDVRKTESAISG